MNGETLGRKRVSRCSPMMGILADSRGEARGHDFQQSLTKTLRMTCCGNTFTYVNTCIFPWEEAELTPPCPILHTKKLSLRQAR